MPTFILLLASISMLFSGQLWADDDVLPEMH